MRTFTMMVGNIGSGKSTWIKNNIKENDIVVSADDFRHMFGAGTYKWRPDLENTIKKSILNLIENLLIHTKRNIIYDETNTTRWERFDVLNVVKKYKCRVVAIVLPRLSKDVSVIRRLNNNHGNHSQQSWEKVWEYKNMYYSEPSADEFDEIIHANLPTSTIVS